MKITNPYSKNRFSRIDKFQRYLTGKLSLLKLKERNNHDFLSSIYWGTRETGISSDSVSIPDDTQVELLTVTVAELISVEELADMKDGMKKLISLYRPSPFYFNDPNQIDEFYNKVTTDIHGRRWSLLGNIKFKENTDIGDYIEHVQIQASQVSSSIIVLIFQIHPSKIYLSEFDNVIKKNVQEERILRPKLKGLFKFWGSTTEFPETVKNRIVEDHILELKWKFFSEISKYLPTFFHENELVSPSVLLYKIKQEDRSEDSSNLFWDSIGLPQSVLSYKNYVHDQWNLIAELDRSLDDSIKITCNSENNPESEFSSIESQIIYEGDYFIRELLPVLAIRKYTLFISEQIANFRISTFKSISNKKVNYKNIIYLRSTIERKGYMLNRIKDEFNPDSLKRRLIRSSFEWAPTNTEIISTPFHEFIVNNTLYLINETFKHSESLVKTLDSTVEILTLQTNFSIQRKTVMLTIVTIILAIVAIYLTYYQISENTPTDLLNFIKEQLI
ncbi:hypothetical protein E2R58_15175 [Paenibacillus amylolyticus]|uniref:hypothetical protein n=1 Tax=Paenibacillus amylolyticus TaxID=1451 RepID=UPI00105A0CBD|nr:hypothetical protein [Paenibacillus amylolyticus]TDL70420.1 hypothetical protein E2R58_15175 [Paenibacillus amylolyticus]